MAIDAPATLLVVDDNPATLYSTSRVLRSAGWTVLEAASGSAALAQAHKGVDLVILDINLPDIDGFEVCRRLRTNSATERTPVIHLSATFVRDVDKVHGLEIGANGYLTHPVEPPVLIATVAAFLRTRRAEEAMRESEVKFRAIFSHAPSGIAVVSDELRFLEVNPAFCDMLRRRSDDIIGRLLVDFVHETQCDAVADTVQQLAGHETWHGILPLLRPDGQPIFLDWRISFHPQPTARLAVAIDITDRLRGERERDQLLASERAARAEAENANRLKDNFLATLSHELRTPLNAIVGWSQLLRRGQSDAAEVEEGLDAIERNARMQTQLISDLLDVSRITTGKLRLELQQADAKDVLDTAVKGLQPAADLKGVTMTRRVEPGNWTILLDPSRMQQILGNLLGNAIKFTPEGGRIDIGLRRTPTHIQISVADNGRGISADLMPHIFERFLQGDSSTTRDQGGLGLGLAISQQLAKLHGGRIEAVSEGEGKGSTFILTLPLRDGLPDDVEGARQSVVASTAATTRLDGARILVVDDDTDARVLMHRVLTLGGAIVQTAAGAAEAIRLIERDPPDVIVSDIAMPGVDGYELLRQVRARGMNIPAIALTAFARQENRERTQLEGFHEHVAKPVDPEQLAAIILRLAGKGGATAARPSA